MPLSLRATRAALTAFAHPREAATLAPARRAPKSWRISLLRAFMDVRRGPYFSAPLAPSGGSHPLAVSAASAILHAVFKLSDRSSQVKPSREAASNTTFTRRESPSSLANVLYRSAEILSLPTERAAPLLCTGAIAPSAI